MAILPALNYDRCKLALVLATLAAGVVFIASGSLKLADIETFRETMELHGVFDAELVPIVAVVVAIAELVGGCLLVGIAITRMALAAGPALACVAFLLLACYCGWMTWHPPSQPVGCGCGVSSRLLQPADWAHLFLRNSLIAGGFALVFLGAAKSAGNSASSRDLTAVPTI